MTCNYCFQNSFHKCTLRLSMARICKTMLYSSRRPLTMLWQRQTSRNQRWPMIGKLHCTLKSSFNFPLFARLKTWYEDAKMPETIRNQIMFFLRYWTVRLTMVVQSAQRPALDKEQSNLSETQHNKWYSTGGRNLSLGEAAAFDACIAVSQQVQ